MKKTVFTLAILMLLAPFAGAQGDKRHIKTDKYPEGFGGSKTFYFAEKLDLDTGQKEKIRAIKDSSGDSIVKAREEIRALMKEVKKELAKKDSDKNKIYRSIDKVADKQKLLSRIRTDQILEIKSILTDEQFRQLSEIMDKKSRRFFHKGKENYRKKNRR